ncbi:MAG: type II toxin-antitoxin system HicB family antitoxin [Cyanobacteria bacterium]|nr:type II toxin-antitoxin system HicB family antitoxin [Cyanobacteriota bacterium]
MLSDYIYKAIEGAVYDKLEDGTFAGRIPFCKGVIAFAPTLKKCEEELHSVFEKWVFLGIKMGHHLPVIKNIDLNEVPQYEQVGSL